MAELIHKQLCWWWLETLRSGGDAVEPLSSPKPLRLNRPLGESDHSGMPHSCTRVSRRA
ncbi:hypothetical protein B0O80DRAFT_171069 [Mortierella sp. GBAus27b]|nr:hypothetical protein B0O80DRAFT_171069 [Mortierella sp. GBAus27b]